MKKSLFTIICCIISLASYAQIVESNVKTTSNHSISTSTLTSLEYSYEQSLGGISTLVVRAGLPNRILWHTYAHGCRLNFQGRTSFAYGATLEPRIYTSLQRRARMGKKTLKNSSDFVALRIQGTLGTPNYPTAEVFAVPMYGIRRVWGEHWFGEFTVGGGISYHNLYGWDLNFKPHIQYRVGFVF